MESRRYLLLLFLVLAVLAAGFLYNFVRLKKEWEHFFNLTLAEERERIVSALRATLAAGGDPVEVLAEYLEGSHLLRGAALILGGRTVIVPGSDIPPKNIVKEVSIPPFRFRLYFSAETFFEVKRHLYLELLLWVFLNALGVGLTLLLLRAYYRSRLELARQQAETERLKSVSLAVASVLHEVKNALNNLNFAVFRLKRKSSAEEVFLLEEEVRRLAAYLEEVSDLRKPPILKRRSVELEPLVRTVLEEFEPQIRELSVEVTVRLRPVTLFADPERLRVVFRNLFRNALEALAASPAPRRLKISGVFEGNSYLVEVADSAGLLPEKTGLFKPYRTEKPGGFGLGLFNVKRIVEAHGGSVEAEVRSGYTVFRIRLPLGKVSD